MGSLTNSGLTQQQFQILFAQWDILLGQRPDRVEREAQRHRTRLRNFLYGLLRRHVKEPDATPIGLTELDIDIYEAISVTLMHYIAAARAAQGLPPND